MEEEERGGGGGGGLGVGVDANKTFYKRTMAAKTHIVPTS